MLLTILALAPVSIIALYIYFRDKYEKEPIRILIKSLVVGVAITYPILELEMKLCTFFPAMEGIAKAAWNAFVVAAGTEETIKFVSLYFLIWRNPNFDEKFDGIVYSAFVALGFAAAENLVYVLQGGLSVGILRAITAIPAHALFGITMGFYFGLAKFYPNRRLLYLRLALFSPILLHGVYDFLLMSKIPVLLILFFPYIIFMAIMGNEQMKKLTVNN